MAGPRLRSFLPRSLFGRALTILLVPIVALQLVVGLVFFQRHYLRVSEQMTRNVAYELDLRRRADRGRRPAAAGGASRIAQLALPLDIWLKLEPGVEVDPGVRRGLFDFTGAKVADTLRQQIHRADRHRPHRPRAPPPSPSRPAAARCSRLVPRDRLSVSNPHQLLVLMILAALLLTGVAVVFLRNQVRPIRALAEAAEAFGKGRSMPFRPAGAEEVRRAGAAFLSMRSRLERQIEQRTQMLSGVSHDLRTPLTRMKLTLALMDETEETRDLLQDTDQMERMLGEFLAFARGDGLEETVATDPFALAAGIVEDARRGGTDVRLVEVGEPRGDVVGAAAPRRGRPRPAEPRRQRRPPRQPRRS